MVYASAVVAPVSAQPHAERHLRVVDAPNFSALPHSIIRDTRVSRDARLLYSVLQMYWWQGGDCYASHDTLAADMGCSLRSLRMYLNELIEANIITETLAGTRRAKVYRPTSNTSKLADCQEFNRQKTTIQSAKNDRSNTSKLADSYKKTPEKKTQEEDLPPSGGSAAVAATAPIEETTTSKKARRVVARTVVVETPVPETIELTETSYETAARWGYSRTAVDFELERFLAKARSKGWTYADWKAAFRTWLLNEVRYAKRDGRPHPSTASAPRTNGAKGWSVNT